MEYDDNLLETELADRITPEELAKITKQFNSTEDKGEYDV